MHARVGCLRPRCSLRTPQTLMDGSKARAPVRARRPPLPMLVLERMDTSLERILAATPGRRLGIGKVRG